MNKLSRKDIAMLEVLAVTEESKGKLAEYIQQREKAAKAYKAFREAVTNGVEVEKVAKPVKPKRKFKAGDKVRVLHTEWPIANTSLQEGDIVTVVVYKADAFRWAYSNEDTRPVIVSGKTKGRNSFFEESALELVEEKTPNKLRAEVIARARACFSDWLQEIYPAYIGYTSRADIRCVEVKLFDCNKLKSKGIAKCSPGDVFNGHIGKAIALGRALGKDVSEFENAVQPDEVVVGHVVNGDEARGFYTQERKFTLTSKRGYDAFYYAEGEEGCAGVEDDFIYNWQIGDIIDDTNAIYKEDSK